MSGKRSAVIAAASILAASAAANAQILSPTVYCPIGSLACISEFFMFSAGSSGYDRLMGAFPRELLSYGTVRSEYGEDTFNRATFRFEHALREHREDDERPREVPEVPDVPPAETPRHEVPDVRDPPPVGEPRSELPIVAPEPSTLILLGATLPFALGFIRGRRKRR
jgi:hypothetical protein